MGWRGVRKGEVERGVRVEVREDMGGSGDEVRVRRNEGMSITIVVRVRVRDKYNVLVC